MKTLKPALLCAIMLPISTCVFAQTLKTVTDSGNTTNNWVQITGLAKVLTTGAGLELYADPATGDGYLKAFNRGTATPTKLRLQDAGGNTIINENQGNVGIGTTAPAAKLEVKGDMKVNTGTQTINLVSGTSSSWYALSIGVNDDGVNFTNNSGMRGFNFSNLNGKLLSVSHAGNVGIASDPQGAYKLAVGGAIIAEKVKVKIKTEWPDYVFAPEYKLPSLQEVEAHIKQHQHLPDMPSAKEVAAEGIDLGEMNRKLLLKVEELTLHLINLNKTVEKQQEEITVLKAQMKEK